MMKRTSDSGIRAQRNTLARMRGVKNEVEAEQLVTCIKCGKEITVSFDSVMVAADIECPNCSTVFTITPSTIDPVPGYEPITIAAKTKAKFDNLARMRGTK